jgi:hypothetical protein
MRFVGKPEGRKPFRLPICRWEDNIKINLSEVGWCYGLDRFLFRIGTGGLLL